MRIIRRRHPVTLLVFHLFSLSVCRLRLVASLSLYRTCVLCISLAFSFQLPRFFLLFIIRFERFVFGSLASEELHFECIGRTGPPNGNAITLHVTDCRRRKQQVRCMDHMHSFTNVVLNIMCWHKTKQTTHYRQIIRDNFRQLQEERRPKMMIRATILFILFYKHTNL